MIANFVSKASRTMDKTEWVTRWGEWFSYSCFDGDGDQDFEYDVDEAKGLLQRRRHYIRELYIDKLRNAFPIAQGWYVLTEAWEPVNLAIPVIVLTRAPKHQYPLVPIDGWHRISKAKKLGLISLPCVLLSKQESDACVIHTSSIWRWERGECQDQLVG